jgi:hypothetical protein
MGYLRIFVDSEGKRFTDRERGFGLLWRAVAIYRAHFLIDVGGLQRACVAIRRPDAPDGNGASAGCYRPAVGVPAMRGA